MQHNLSNLENQHADNDKKSIVKKYSRKSQVSFLLTFCDYKYYFSEPSEIRSMVN